MEQNEKSIEANVNNNNNDKRAWSEPEVKEVMSIAEKTEGGGFAVPRGDDGFYQS